MATLASRLGKIQPSVEIAQKSGDLPRHELVQRVAEKNVEQVVQEVREKSKVLDAMIAEGQVGIVGAMYSVQSGTIEFQDMFCGNVG